jgi:hypothetical protein
LRDEGIKIRHILEDGSIEEHPDSLRRLLRTLKLQESNLFQSPEEIIENAYEIQGEKIAHVENPDGDNE